jgi:hypothetical protein
MATLNVSEKQKKRVVAVQALVATHLPVSVSQADVVDMGMALLEEKYKLNTKRIDNVLNQE